MKWLYLRLLERSCWRCWIVDFLKDEDRLGIVENRVDGSDEFPPSHSLSSCARLSLNKPPSTPSDSKMLKSSPGPWRLLRLAEGLSKAGASSDLRPSDRFMGLRGATAVINMPPLRLFSCRVCAVFQLSGSSGDLSFSFSSPPVKHCRASSRSVSAELLLRSGIGDALPLSLESAKARLVGLLGDVRSRLTP